MASHCGTKVWAFLFLPLQFKCCGSNNSHDWTVSKYLVSGQAEGRAVPDSCCKTITPHCGKRDHPSNIYKVEVSAINASGKMTAGLFSLPVAQLPPVGSISYNNLLYSFVKCVATWLYP